MSKVLTDRTAARLMDLLNAGTATSAKGGTPAPRKWVFARCDSATAVGGNDILDQCYPATILQPITRGTLPPDEHPREVLLTLLGEDGESAVPIEGRCYVALLGDEVESDGSGSLAGRPRCFGAEAKYGDVIDNTGGTTLDRSVAIWAGTAGAYLSDSLATIDSVGRLSATGYYMGSSPYHIAQAGDGSNAWLLYDYTIPFVNPDGLFRLGVLTAYTNVTAASYKTLAGATGGSATTGGLTFSQGLYISGTSTALTQAAADALYQPLDADLTTIAGLADPNADRILFWDDSAGAYAYLEVSTGLSITGTVLTAAGVSDGDKGDITVSGGGATWTIDDGVVTFAKMQTVSANILLGNDASGTAVEEITCTAAGRALLDDADAAAQRATLGATAIGSAVFTGAGIGQLAFIRVNADDTVTFLTPTQTMTNLGAQTVGQAIFTLTNPSAIRFLRINADNSVTARSAADMLADLGGVATTRTISTTAPLTGGGDLSANRTLAISNFVAGGGSAAAGAVPTPGATAYPTQPQVLLSTAAWGVNYGATVAEAAVDTSETTSSTSYVGLTTACTVTVTIDVTADYVVEMASNVSNSTAGANCLCAIDIDGTDTDLIQHDCVTANEPYQAYGARVINITAGSRVFTMQHRVGAGAGTGSFKWRWFRVSRKK